MKLRDLLIAFGLALAVMALNVAASFGWVWIYSLMEPGQTPAAYQAYAQRIAPLSSVIFGMPLMFAAGWLVGRSRERRRALLTGLAIAGLYVTIDAAIVFGIGASGALGPVVLASWLTKIAAAGLGAWSASKRR